MKHTLALVLMVFGLVGCASDNSLQNQQTYCPAESLENLGPKTVSPSFKGCSSGESISFESGEIYTCSEDIPDLTNVFLLKSLGGYNNSFDSANRTDCDGDMYEIYDGLCKNPVLVSPTKYNSYAYKIIRHTVDPGAYKIFSDKYKRSWDIADYSSSLICYWEDSEGNIAVIDRN